MKTAYFDCISGAAGDMIVGACLDAGAPEAHLRAELEKLQLPHVHVKIEKVSKKAIAATAFTPEPPPPVPGLIVYHSPNEGLAFDPTQEGGKAQLVRVKTEPLTLRSAFVVDRYQWIPSVGEKR